MAAQPNNTEHHLTLAEQLHKIALFTVSEGYADIADCTLNTMQRLNSRQSRAVAHVYRYSSAKGKGMPMSMLAKALHMSPSAASHMVAGLEKSSHLIRQAADKDHRSVLVQVHPNYIPYAQHMEAGMQKALDYLKAPLTEEELTMFTRCVEIMYARACSRTEE